ncbi:MAG: 2-oxoacid:acceptor oxidoreductase subunit alpha [Bacteriovoracaceae bacterium]|nr:2-oxoacid:acceptor oxidoreductase subunit alpha [Bacteriovoracaceae bacterium]
MTSSNSIDSVVIRFAGDSGDGMQLTGTQFSNTSAIMGNDIATFPDYPSEIRAPSGTVAGVSGFQVHIGATEIYTPGDDVDMLVAMNPAALKANLHSVKPSGYIVVNIDAFTEKNLEKAKYTTNPLEDGSLQNYRVIQAPITSQTVEALKEIAVDSKTKDRCKNFYALGMTYYFYNRSRDTTIKWIEDKFKSKPEVVKANIAALKAGECFAENTETVISTYTVPVAKIPAGDYRQIDGNTATAWGLIRAAEMSGLQLFLGSYPITPATDILHELSKHKEFGVKTFQAEDEIAGICSAIGAACAGSLAVTTTSGPGMALKTEAIGLAISYELPLVIVNVQRGGPSTGLPTKTEQSDLFQAIWGRNGESPLVVMAASRPSDCFASAYEASRIALKHMTPVILLTDGYIANGAEPWKLPDVNSEFGPIEHRMVDPEKLDKANFHYMTREDHTLARPWVVPGMPGLEFRMGGLEKDIKTGCVSTDPRNHELMCLMRQKKVDLVADDIPLQTVEGAESGDLLVVSWGGTYGSCVMAVRKLQAEGKKVSHMHLKYLNPMPKNVGTILNSFKKVIIPELNLGQLKTVINAKYGVNAKGYNKVQGLPFKISELVTVFNQELIKE